MITPLQQQKGDIPQDTLNPDVCLAKSYLLLLVIDTSLLMHGLNKMHVTP